MGFGGAACRVSAFLWHPDNAAARQTAANRRRGLSADTVQRLHKAFRLLASKKLNTAQALERIAAEIEPCDEVSELVRFVQSSERGVIK